jgi:diguanylate cyclase (GGDEF)-like protein
MVAHWVPPVSVNALGLAVLLVLLVNIKARGSRFLVSDQRLFMWMLVVNIAMLVLDAGTWLLNGQRFAGARALNLAVTAAYYALDPLMSLLYLIYCDNKLGVPRTARRKLLPLYLLPIAVNLVLTVLSIQGSYLFHIGADNRYARGSLLALSFVLSSVLMGVAFIRVARFTRRRLWGDVLSNSRVTPNGVNSLLLFALPPLVGVVVQVWFNQITVVWIGTVLSLLVVFINIQNVEIATDSLTGLMNRRQTDTYLPSLMQVRDRVFTLIVMDLNHFKQINDHHGHIAGDNALKAMGAVLRAVCRRDEFFSRYGGDEFVVITQDGNEAYAEDLINRLNDGLAVHCRRNRLPFRLSLCAGFAVRIPAIESSDALFALADARLYEQKTALRRRATDR